MIVLDASAVLTFLLREIGWTVVGPQISGAAISAVNLSEVLARFADVPMGDADVIFRQLTGLGSEFVPVTSTHALTAAKLRPLTKSQGLSLGDRVCLSLAIERQCPAVTADRNWAKLDIGIPIVLIR